MFNECMLEGDFKLSSGKVSDTFYDFDLLSPRETANYINQLLSQLEGVVDWDSLDFIVSPAIGGIVPGFLIAFAKDLPLVILDKEGNLRGPEFKTGKYLLVDDVISTFKAAEEVKAALPNMQCLGIVAYIFRGSYENLNKQEIPVYYLSRKEQES